MNNSFKSRLSYHENFKQEQNLFRIRKTDHNASYDTSSDLQEKKTNLDKYMRKNDKTKTEEICYSRDIANTFYEDKISEKV